MKFFLSAFLLLSHSFLIASQNNIEAGEVITILGTGKNGYSGEGKLATQAKCGAPFGVVIGPDGNLYVCETTSHVIRKVNLKTGIATTVAGSGIKGYCGDGDNALQAKLNEPYEVRFAKNSDMYFVEMKNHLVRKVDHQSGKISTVAGNGQQGYQGDGELATLAKFNRPHSITFDAQENLYICDIGNHRLRVVDAKTHIVTTFSGNGKKGKHFEFSKTFQIPLSGPRALDFDGQFLWLALREGNAIYKIDLQKKMIQLVAGVGGKPGYQGDNNLALKATLAGPKGIAVDQQGNIFLADTESHTIRKINAQTGIITTLVGNGKKGDGPDGNPESCKLNRPHGICVAPNGRVYIGDSNNHRVRCYIP